MFNERRWQAKIMQLNYPLCFRPPHTAAAHFIAYVLLKDAKIISFAWNFEDFPSFLILQTSGYTVWVNTI